MEEERTATQVVLHCKEVATHPEKYLGHPEPILTTMARVVGPHPSRKIGACRQEEKRQRELEELEAARALQVEECAWWDKDNMDDQTENVKKEKISEEELEKLRMLNIIKAQERCRTVIKRNIHEKLKREHWEKILLGLNKPEKPAELKNRAADLIQKTARLYFALKRKKILDCQRDAMLGLAMCERPTDDLKIKGEEITEKRKAMKKQYDEEWKCLYEKLKNKCLKEKSEEIQEDYRDELRSWFHKWYKEAWFFYDIPKAKQGGSILILKEEVPAPPEWKTQNQAYISQKNANKGKSSEQAIHNYQKEWADLDKYETVDVKRKFVKDIDEHNAWAEVKLALRPSVDEDMRDELKKLKEALKKDYEAKEQQWPEAIMPQKFPKLPKQKKVKEHIDDKVVKRMVDLVMKEVMKQYPKTKFEDFKGEPNFAGDDLRCNFKYAMPYGGETRNVWWERCRDLAQGFNKVLLVGPSGSGKTILAYAISSVNDAVLFELNICSEHYGNVESEELNELSKAIITCAQAAQPAVIYIRNLHRLFYTKVPPAEGDLERPLIIKLLLKKLTKKFKKSDRVTIIGTCKDPWMTRSAQMLKLFPTVVMMPNTTYTTTHAILREWVVKNRMVPVDLDITSLAQVLRGYSYGYLLKVLQDFLSAERIVRMAAHGLYPHDIYQFILNDENQNENCVEYDKYLKWYSEKTSWGAMEKRHLEDQIEYQELEKKYMEKEKKKKRPAPSAASSAASSIQ
ncbi:ATPase family associated with various cellular activities (AAA) domain-containing protein [Phthorimaea operculella]|nr:ATPase family associated with various cellular activities (AAA) domain-containing protein [Phthorimaea operculella]